MPTGPFLYADQLIGTLRNKSASKCDRNIFSDIGVVGRMSELKVGHDASLHRKFFSQAVPCSGYAERVLSIEAGERGSFSKECLMRPRRMCGPPQQPTLKKAAGAHVRLAYLRSPSSNWWCYCWYLTSLPTLSKPCGTTTLTACLMQTVRASFPVHRLSLTHAWATCTQCRGWKTVMSGLDTNLHICHASEVCKQLLNIWGATQRPDSRNTGDAI